MQWLVAIDEEGMQYLMGVDIEKAAKEETKLKDKAKCLFKTHERLKLVFKYAYDPVDPRSHSNFFAATNISKDAMHEIQWLIYDATIFISLIYKKVERWLHIDVYREDTHRKYDFQAGETHIVVIVIFEAKKITRKEHQE